MRTNKREFAIERETTPGTAETLVVGDLLVRTREGDSVEADFDLFDTEEVQATSSRRPNLVGRKSVAFPISYILRGPGDESTVPAVADLIESAMMVRQKVERLTIGAVSGGPYTDGETITGGTSSATGTVFRDTANGASEIKYVSISGTFATGETLTGGTSSATSTSSSTPGDRGYKWTPADSDFGGSDSKHHVTARMNQDGFQWTGRGCLSNISMAFSVGRPCIVSQRFLGALTSHGDAALLEPATYPEEAIVAPRFLNASLQLGSYTPTDIVDLTFGFETNPQEREDANDSAADGVLYADYDRDAPSITLEPAMVSAATKDWLEEIQSGTTFAVEWTLGSATGATWDFFADLCQYTEIGAGARRSIATAPITLRCNGTNNDDFAIWQH